MTEQKKTKWRELHCPCCRAPLRTSQESVSIVCEYCNTRVDIERPKQTVLIAQQEQFYSTNPASGWSGRSWIVYLLGCALFFGGLLLFDSQCNSHSTRVNNKQKSAETEGGRVSFQPVVIPSNFNKGNLQKTGPIPAKQVP